MNSRETMKRTSVLAALTITGAVAATAEAQLQVFRSRAAFVMATDSESATGPIPNLGIVAEGPDDSFRLGNLTLSPAPGIDPNKLMLGGGPASTSDWTCLNPGFEMAMDNETLHVRFDEPVPAMGFYFVEPRATLCEGCGVPVDSIFEVTLYDGATVVGSFTFNARDDVRAFVGVASDAPFDQADIVDTTGDDDDEYFGEFFAPLTAPDCPEQ